MCLCGISYIPYSFSIYSHECVFMTIKCVFMTIKYLLKHQYTHICKLSMVWWNKCMLWHYTNLNLKYGPARLPDF